MDWKRHKQIDSSNVVFKSLKRINGEVGTEDAPTKKKEVQSMVGTFELFRFANIADVLFMICGTFSALVNGVAMPILFLLISKMTNDFIVADAGSNTVNAKMLNATSREAEIAKIGLELVENLKLISLYFVGVGLGVWVVSYLQMVCWGTTSERQCRTIRLRLFHTILRQHIGWFDTHEIGQLNTRMTDDINKIKEGTGEKVGHFFQYLSMGLTSFIISFIYGWKLTLVIVSISPLIAIGSFMTTKFMADLTSGELLAYAEAGSVAEEVLGAIRTVAAFGGQEKESLRYASRLDSATEKGIKKGIINGAGMGFNWFTTLASYALAFWYGSRLVRDPASGYDAEHLLIVLFSVLFGAYSIGTAAPYLQSVSVGRVAAFSVYASIDEVSEIDSFSEGGRQLTKYSGNIRLQNVHFSYPSRKDVKVLNGVSLHINMGERVAIVGASGCGKSTVIQLLTRFYDPTSGTVTFDGIDIKELNTRWLRERIGIVSQEPVLFDTTIAENIQFGCLSTRQSDSDVANMAIVFEKTMGENISRGHGEVTQSELEEAAKQANAYDFIMELPNKFETLVGEGGAQLSGGQKQRIAIARALVRNPTILLLDEATSALDNESEAIVQEALDKASTGRTTITIAHRLSTIRGADRIVAIDKGEVVEQGTHDELMQNEEGVYAKLVRAQIRTDVNDDDFEDVHLKNAKNHLQQLVSVTSIGSNSLNMAGPKKGEVVEQDTHDELMQNEEGVYAKLVRASTRTDVNDDDFEDVHLKNSKNHLQRLVSVTSIGSNSPKMLEPKKGEVVEQDTHDELMQNEEGVYAKLVRASTRTDVNDDDFEDVHLKNSKNHLQRLVSVTSIGSNSPKMLEPKKKEDELPAPNMKRVFRMNAPEWHFITIGTISALINGAIQPVFAFIISKALFVFKVESELNKYCIGFVGLAFLIFLTFFFQGYMYGLSGERLTKRIRDKAFRCMVHQDMSWFDDHKNNTGALCTRLATDASQVQGVTGARLGTLVQQVGSMLVAIGIGFGHEWAMTLLILAFVPFIMASGYIEMIVMSGTTLSNKAALEGAGKLSVEAIGNIRTLASLTQEKWFYNEYIQRFNGPYKAALKKAHVIGLAYGFSQGITFFIYATAFYFGAYRVESQAARSEDIFIVYLALEFGALAAGQATSFAPDFGKARTSAACIFQLFDRVSLINSNSPHGLKPEENSFTSCVKFQDVRFDYPTRPDVKVLRGLTLAVEPGETVALVGSSGCGKSTVVQLVERFYDAREGQLRLDTHAVADLNVQWMRAQIGVVSQEPVLFDRTIRENIEYGDNTRAVAMDEVIAAARQANIHDFITTLPKAYETNVGAKGTQLSGGQKQRVAIARALVRNPKILLLDEATSALDTENEKIVQEALDRAREGRTCIVIAHRLSTIQNVNKIFVIRHGVVSETGSHSELMANRKFYYRLHLTQTM